MKDSQKNNIIFVNNVGYIDATIRLLIGIGGIASLYALSGNDISYWLAAITFLSVYPILTSICLWDPLYELANFTTNKENSKRALSIEGFLSQSFQYLQAETGKASNDSSRYDANQVPDKNQAA